MVHKNRCIKDIKSISTSNQKVNRESETKYTITFNNEQLKQAATDTLTLLKITDNALTLLRAGYINSDLLDLETLKHVISEGSKFFKHVEFPIKTSDKSKIHEITSLLEVKHVDNNNFIIIVPLVQKESFTVTSLIPHTVQLTTGTLMILSLPNDVILYNAENDLIMKSSDILTINNGTHIVKQVPPKYSIHQATCEQAGPTGNNSLIIALCNFNKVGVTNNIHFTDLKHHRVVYLSEKNDIQLNCPKEKIRDSLIGLYLIPLQCDYLTESVQWQAKLEKNYGYRAFDSKLKERPISRHHILTDISNKRNLKSS